MKEQEFPKSLLQAARYFADPDTCVEFVAGLRWFDGPVCPYCEGKKVSYLKTRRIYKCMAKECHKQFSVKVGTIFEDSAIPLDKWLTAIWLIVNCKNGISSYEIARDLKVTQKSAWFMLHRIRLALANSSWFKLGGEEGGPVEADETYMGGKERNKHIQNRRFIPDGKGGFMENPEYKRRKGKQEKAPVFGVLDRELRKVRAHVIPNVKRDVLIDAILENVDKKSTVYTDDHSGYRQLDSMEDYVHESVSHVNEYVRGEVHTNGIENFWSLLKRGIKGTYVSVEPFHLDAYVTEQVFRFNNRATKDNPLTDADRFVLAVSQTAGRRLTYAELTGKVGETTEEPF
jgi:transposase-like protein